MTKQIFLEIIAHVKSKTQEFTDCGLTPPKHYDRFNNQYRVDKQILEHPYPCPAIFIEIEIDWENEGQLTRVGNCTIKVHKEQENYAYSADGSSNQDEALKTFEFSDLVDSLLHGVALPSTGRFINVRSKPETDGTNQVVDIAEFKCVLKDNSTHRNKGLRDNGGDANLNIDPVTLVEKITPPGGGATKYTAPN